MKIDIKNIIIAVLLIALLFFIFKKKETIEVPVRIEIPIAAKEGKTDTIYLPSPVKEVIRYKEKEVFVQADSITKDSLYTDAITERDYSEIFNDSIQTITVNTKVQGKLLKQSAEYYIKPDTIEFDTILTINDPKRNQFYLSMEVGQNVNNLLSVTPIFKPGIMFKTKKNTIISLSYDSNNNVFLGGAFKL